jgi:hypothetical protein
MCSAGFTMADRRHAGGNGTGASLFELYAQGRHAEVLEAGQEELERRPRDPALLCLLAQASVATGDPGREAGFRQRP